MNTESTNINDIAVINLCTTIIVSAFMLYRELTKEPETIEVPLHVVK